MAKKTVLLILLLLLLVGCSKTDYKSSQEANDYHEINRNGKSYDYNTSLWNILVVGTDKENLSGQADFLGLIVIDRDEKKINFINIPRETKVTVSVYDGENYLGESNSYINMVYTFNGEAERGAKETVYKVSEILNNIPIQSYVVASTDIFSDLVDIFGEMEIELPDDSLTYKNEAWVKGYKFTVNKETIEIFLRNRDLDQSFSPENRRLRQNLYIQNIQGRINKINEDAVIKAYEKCLSNLSLEEVEAFLDSGYTMGNFYYLPGEYVQSDYYDEFELDEDGIDEFIVKVFYKEID